ncbi:MAG: bifunctional nuclease family protein [Actinomycetes bacterium]|jgi:uncharacterized protein|nr:bifunctional nuclease family protein [Candidatus Nanopelagicales bacterium]MDP4826013.1 bifunctional nuclease family protein [Candidatus Nanopelagicales bacterium]MDP4888873.1 bifunctional nuclease family protein [Candidatus Nanopelagicales bacterium]
MKPVEVVGVRVEMPSSQPIVLLREVDGERFLPIWIGAVEATAIAQAQQGLSPDRPLTHELMRNILTAHNRELTAVNIVSLEDGVFFADLVFLDGVEVSARPSDAIALALRTGTPVFVADDVLDEAAIELPEESPDENTEVEKFREFLDQISPEDFGSGPAAEQ